MNSYELFVLLHIVGVIVWLGAGATFTMLILRAELAGDAEQKAQVNASTEWLAPRLFIPASLSVVIFGLITMIDGPWGLDQLWVAIGLAGWLASFAVGFGFFKPEGARIDALVNEHGPGSEIVRSRIARLELVGRIELTVLFLVVADMVIKPTGDDTGVLIAMAAILVGVVALLLSRSRV